MDTDDRPMNTSQTTPIVYPLREALTREVPMTDKPVTVELATAEMSTEVARVIGAAFADLEASQWLAPDDGWRNETYWRFFQHAYVDPAFLPGRGTVYVTADHLAAAVWLHHEPWLDETPTEAFVAELEQITGPFFDNFVEFGGLLDKAHARYKDVSHDYCGVIGAHPSIWRQGSGRALMQAHLAHLDRSGRPAYLEAANTNRVGIWRKFGFEPTEDVVTLPNGHQLFPMWREPART